MADALVGASHLTAGIRLAQAVSEFEASLKDDHKSIFRNWKIDLHTKPPDSWEVKRLTIELDRSVAQNTRRCYGPRFINVLESVQQYASLGDVVLGGSQNLTACGAWAVVRLTLTMLSNGAAHIEKLSLLFMRAGQNAPRYQNMAMFYPRSYRLQDGLCEYLILVIHLCTYAVRFINKTSFSQISTSAFDTKLSKLEKDLNLWASFVMEEVASLNSQVVVDESRHNSSFRKMVTRFKSSSEGGRYLDAKLRLLDSLSTHDHQTTWKQARKRGLATWFTTSSEYEEWKGKTSSSSLLCSGKLGSGKTTMMASMVDDLTFATSAGQVAYFFCRHDIAESLSAKTVLGCLTRQLLLHQSIDFGKLERVCGGQISSLSYDGVWEVLQAILPTDGTYYLLIDGLDECSHHDLSMVFDILRKLQQHFKVLVCISFRTEARSFVGTNAKKLTEPFTLRAPEKNPDIDAFILCELNARLESEELSIGSSSVMTAICDALQTGAQGMFLWVSLLLDWICAEHTDEAILRALHDLPKDLTETFTRILESQKSHSNKYQRTIVLLIMAARRPLTTEELQEALSVTPGKTDWDPMQRINNIHATLACCRSLIIIDEEESTVRFAHHSIKTFFMEYEGKTFHPVGSKEADDEMGMVILTYVNYGMFDQQVSRMTIPNIPAGSTPSTVISSALRGTSASAKHLVEGLLRSRTSTDPDVIKVLAGTAFRYRGLRPQNPVYFLKYAQSHYLYHIQPSLVGTGLMKGLWEQMFDQDRLNEMPITPWLAYQFDKCQVKGIVGSFVPLDTLDRLCTPEVVRAVLREAGIQVDDVTSSFNNNKRCFATLVKANITGLAQLFHQQGVYDLGLPIPKDRLTERMSPTMRQFGSHDFATSIESFCHGQFYFASTIRSKMLLGLDCPVIPLISMTEQSTGVYAPIETIIRRAVIPHGHHRFTSFDSVTDGSGFNVVMRQATIKPSFLHHLPSREVSSHSHLITALAAFRTYEGWYEIWPLTSGNLYEFWACHSSTYQEPQMTTWSLRQMVCLANALYFLHDGGASTLYDSHGCISPENIKWISVEPHSYGTLKIDLSSSETHRLTSDPSSYNPGLPRIALVFKELDLENLSFLYVQSFSWCLLGSAGLAQLSAALGEYSDYLYTGTHSDHMKQRVAGWASELSKKHSRNQTDLDILNYIVTTLHGTSLSSQQFDESLGKMVLEMGNKRSP